MYVVAYPANVALAAGLAVTLRIVGCPADLMTASVRVSPCTSSPARLTWRRPTAGWCHRAHCRQPG